MKARLLYQSSRIETYTNLVVAICNKYSSIEEICISFIDLPINEKFIDDLQSSLTTYHNSSLYKKAARIRLTSERINIHNPLNFKEWNLIDVSAISKENAINVVASNLENPKVEVCILNYKKRFKSDEKWILTSQNHEYNDLLSDGALSKLYKNYFQKKVVIKMFAGLFIILFGMSLIKFLIPTFIIPNDIINIFSLLIGASGLYLAAESLKER